MCVCVCFFFFGCLCAKSYGASVVFFLGTISLFEVHDFKNYVYNSMYKHGFCMYAMVCMEMAYFTLEHSLKYKLAWEIYVMIGCKQIGRHREIVIIGYLYFMPWK